jgi:hypothetical protein
MAFSDIQRAKIRHYLGYPDVFRAANPRLEDAMNVVGDRPEVQADIEVILGHLATADAQIAGQGTTSAAGVKRVDEIEFFPKGETDALTEARRWGRMWASRLSIVLGVPIANDVFSERGYSGDWWSRFDMQVGAGNGHGGGGGGMIPFG